MSKRNQKPVESEGLQWLRAMPKPDRCRLSVPELANDEGDAFVFYFNALTLKEGKKLRQKSAGSDQEFLAYCVIEKAENEGGEKIFSVLDKEYLMTQVAGTVVSYMGNSIIAFKGDADYEADEAEEAEDGDPKD